MRRGSGLYGLIELFVHIVLSHATQRLPSPGPVLSMVMVVSLKLNPSLESAPSTVSEML